MWRVEDGIKGLRLTRHEAQMMPCASLERWHEYAGPLVGGMESVLQCVSSDMRDKLDEYAVFVESAYPERRHETLTCLLRSLARAYTMLPRLPLRSSLRSSALRRSIFEASNPSTPISKP